jgi:hypothetical protein
VKYGKIDEITGNGPGTQSAGYNLSAYVDGVLTMGLMIG